MDVFSNEVTIRAMLSFTMVTLVVINNILITFFPDIISTLMSLSIKLSCYLYDNHDDVYMQTITMRRYQRSFILKITHPADAVAGYGTRLLTHAQSGMGQGF